MTDPLKREEVVTLREWLASWGPVGQPNWADPKGISVPIEKGTLARLLDAAARGVDGFEQDAISYAEAHGVRKRR